MFSSLFLRFLPRKTEPAVVLPEAEPVAKPPSATVTPLQSKPSTLTPSPAQQRPLRRSNSFSHALRDFNDDKTPNRTVRRSQSWTADLRLSVLRGKGDKGKTKGSKTWWSRRISAHLSLPVIGKRRRNSSVSTTAEPPAVAPSRECLSWDAGDVRRNPLLMENYGAIAMGEEMLRPLANLEPDYQVADTQSPRRTVHVRFGDGKRIAAIHNPPLRTDPPRLGPLDDFHRLSYSTLSTVPSIVTSDGPSPYETQPSLYTHTNIPLPRIPEHEVDSDTDTISGSSMISTQARVGRGMSRSSTARRRSYMSIANTEDLEGVGREVTELYVDIMGLDFDGILGRWGQ